MKVMSVLFARWKGAKITTEHPMHVLRAYRVSLASLRPNQLRIMAKCEPGSKIYTECINALQSVEEIGRLTLDDARTAGNTSEPAVGRGRQAGGRQGHGRRQSSQRHTSSRRPTTGRRHTSDGRHTPVHDHTMGVIHICSYLCSLQICILTNL
ncbi:hypothetical protein CMV_015221 [Castanea mollissima]|uniref:Uncharacterized protein n=1 Tax=Castanea mollissima TaxID=60419 RepID=A0A8J4VK90_9ROSI|nr:hypothetical protein CMV_015221 [Castanea mollissima]